MAGPGAPGMLSFHRRGSLRLPRVCRCGRPREAQAWQGHGDRVLHLHVRVGSLSLFVCVLEILESGRPVWREVPPVGRTWVEL